MAKPKSKLIANRSAHAVALSNDGVATRRQSATKVKKDEVDGGPGRASGACGGRHTA
jgi:hypothetical protein